MHLFYGLTWHPHLDGARKWSYLRKIYLFKRAWKLIEISFITTGIDDNSSNSNNEYKYD